MLNSSYSDHEFVYKPRPACIQQSASLWHDSKIQQPHFAQKVYEIYCTAIGLVDFRSITINGQALSPLQCITMDIHML